VGYLDWVAEQARQDGVDHILFVSRDGYVLQRLARRRPVGELPAFSYLLGSRVSFGLAAIEEGNFADYLPFLLSGADGLGAAEVLARIGVVPPGDHVMEDLALGPGSVVTPDSVGRIARFLYAYRWEILKVCRRNRQGLFEHLLRAGVRSGMRIGLVDVGWN